MNVNHWKALVLCHCRADLVGMAVIPLVLLLPTTCSVVLLLVHGR